MGAMGERVPYLVGTMIELPRAALTADQIAVEAEFFSFGTNDLTQTMFGLSRDDAGRFLPAYIELGILADDPFQVLDERGVGALIQSAVAAGRSVRPGLKVGHLRRARWRAPLRGILPPHRIGLRVVLAVPRAGRAARRRAGGASASAPATGLIAQHRRPAIGRATASGSPAPVAPCRAQCHSRPDGDVRCRGRCLQRGQSGRAAPSSRAPCRTPRGAMRSCMAGSVWIVVRQPASASRPGAAACRSAHGAPVRRARWCSRSVVPYSPPCTANAATATAIAKTTSALNARRQCRRSRPGILRGVAELLFDAQQLIVLRDAVGAARRSGLDLAGVRRRPRDRR